MGFWIFRDRSSDHLTFKEQYQLVKDGLSKGVKYDGCTAVPDFDFGADCCGEHDYHYQVGDISRSAADARLRECLRAKGYFLMPWIYWLGVRIFGRAHYKKLRNEHESVTGNNGSDAA